MFKKLLLLICIAFVVVCFAYPCFIVPFGEYKATVGSGETKVEYSYTFDFKGNAVYKRGGIKFKYFYKLDGDEIILSEDKKFDDSDRRIEINSMYEIEATPVVGEEMKLENNIGKYIAIGVGAFAILIVLIMPNKYRR